MRSSEADEKLSYQVRFRTFPYLVISSTAFFLPLTASRVYETAYQLSFKGINNCTIETTLSLTALLLFIMVSSNANLRLKVLFAVSTGFSVTFQVAIAFTQGLQSPFVLHLYIAF